MSPQKQARKNSATHVHQSHGLVQVVGKPFIDDGIEVVTCRILGGGRDHEPIDLDTSLLTGIPENPQDASLNELTFTELTIEEKIAALEDELEENGGAFGDEGSWDAYEALILERDGLTDAITKKIDRTHYVIARLSEEKESIDARKKALEVKLTKPLLAARKRREASIKRLKKGIINLLDARGDKRIEGDMCKYTLVESSSEKHAQTGKSDELRPADKRIQTPNTVFASAAQLPSFASWRLDIDMSQFAAALAGDLTEDDQRTAQQMVDLGYVEVQKRTSRYVRSS